MIVRSQARALVLQCLYELDFTGHSFEQILDAHVVGKAPAESVTNYAMRMPPRGMEFVRMLGGAVEQHLAELDALAAKFALEWPLDQISAIDRNVLRIAICEMLFTGDAPDKVVINEAVELAKLFGGDSSPRFVNGVLGAVVAQKTAQRKTAA